jgi:hypothetical protein
MVPDAKWEQQRLELLQRNLESRLPEDIFDVAYRKHAPINSELRLYAADFVVSALHPFPRADLAFARKTPRFRVKAGPFRKAKAALETKIADALRQDHVTAAIAYEYVASRAFIVADYVSGTLLVEHVISENDGIRAEIELLNNEVEDCLQRYGWHATLETKPTRRPKDNLYEFSLVATQNNAYREDNVSGSSLVLVEKNMSVDEVEKTGGITPLKRQSAVAENENEGELRSFLDTELPYSVKSLNVTWIDSDDDLIDIHNEMTETP